jgi:RNA polymerase sigma-70 factor (ECF subfamily)
MTVNIENERIRKLLLSLPGKAIEILYDKYYSKLLRIAKFLSRDEKVAEDIVQETYVHVWENHKKLGQYHEQPIYTYMIKVVKNKAIGHFRDTIRLSKHQIEYLNGTVLDAAPSIEARIIRIEINEEIRQLIATFPRREKECLLLKMDKELSVKQIAEILNVTDKAVERSLTSAKKRLRKHWLSRK